MNIKRYRLIPEDPIFLVELDACYRPLFDRPYFTRVFRYVWQRIPNTARNTIRSGFGKDGFHCEVFPLASGNVAQCVCCGQGLQFDPFKTMVASETGLRFTIAHELAHVHQHAESPLPRDSKAALEILKTHYLFSDEPRKKRRCEREADAIASSWGFSRPKQVDFTKSDHARIERLLPAFKKYWVREDEWRAKARAAIKVAPKAREGSIS